MYSVNVKRVQERELLKKPSMEKTQRRNPEEKQFRGQDRRFHNTKEKNNQRSDGNRSTPFACKEKKYAANERGGVRKAQAELVDENLKKRKLGGRVFHQDEVKGAHCRTS